MNPSILRDDYTPYPYAIPHLALTFELDLHQTIVHSRFQVHTAHAGTTLQLDGEDLILHHIWVDGEELMPHQYQLEAKRLCIPLQKPSHLIEITSQCAPSTNTSLMGLYQSGQQLFTQCEPEGFRRITWFADRPDVLSRYTVTLRGTVALLPYMLSNGNLISSTTLADGKHEAIWEDPFAKPSYLFAVVAGDFDCREARLNTASGREVLLQLYSDKGDKPKTEWAMQSLIHALRWDEQRFGLELDLDRYMIVSASDFNMGAMENKGLNVFNAAYVLAQPDTTTDQSYRDIEAVIGHEYFHNWTGNRVTCRDWFQLSLKEGLTVFREQEFSADRLAAGLDGAAAASAKAVKRIDDVTLLRMAQFPEDAGPMAHPIRPNSYEEISNFYTATIYEKGAEVIRMFHTLLGEAGFQAALKNYFTQFDGQAISCDDFIAIMDQQYQQQFPSKDLRAFAGWYEQAGTPHVKVALDYDATTHCATLTLSQYNPPVGIELLAEPIAPKAPLLIPVKIGFLTASGQKQAVHFAGQQHHEFMLNLEQAQQQFVFSDVKQAPVLSLLRDFSAPITISMERTPADLITLAKYDDNAFARWQAIQELAHAALLNTDTDLSVWQQILEDSTLSAAYRSRALTLPTVRQLLAQQRPINPLATHAAHTQLEQRLAHHFTAHWSALYQALHDDSPVYSPDAHAAGQRALKNLALKQLMLAAHPDAIALAQQQYQHATNMTDRSAAFQLLVHYADATTRHALLQDFYEQWQDNALVLDRWFSVQASAPYFDAAQALQLQQHPDFTLRNPNRARALIFQFCSPNSAQIHTAAGYDFWRDQVLALDKLNPEIAARLCRVFDNWSHYVEPLRTKLQQRLQSIAAQDDISAHVSEIVKKALTIDTN